MKRFLMAGAVCLWAVQARATYQRQDFAQNVMVASADAMSHQPDNPNDLEIAQSIHRTVGSAMDLSDSARNATIIINNGNVTLHGMAASRNERDSIENKVKAVPGVNRVTNYMEIKGGN